MYWVTRGLFGLVLGGLGGFAVVYVTHTRLTREVRRILAEASRIVSEAMLILLEARGVLVPPELLDPEEKAE